VAHVLGWGVEFYTKFLFCHIIQRIWTPFPFCLLLVLGRSLSGAQTRNV
jgi:hypothetical protein